MRMNFFFLTLLSGVVSASAVNPEMNKVYEFIAAPGQFVNTLPEWEEGDDEEAMCTKALDMMRDGGFISLGAYGGYVTVGFETTIVNVENKRDIYIQGNMFNGGAEPGVVMVSYDINGNGLPDDEWFEIAGSEYKNSVLNYEITYRHPASADDDIEWTDNKGGSGKVLKNQYHKQPYWPQWLDDKETLIFHGTRLPDNSTNQGTEDAPYYVLDAFEYGYADNQPNMANGEYNDAAKIDIDWAVDANGNSVEMPGVDFVRIYTGINQYNGWIGECSTEVGCVYNDHTSADGTVDESIKMDEDVLKNFLEKYSSVESVANNAVCACVSSEGILSVTLSSPEQIKIFNQLGLLMQSVQLSEGSHQLDISTYPDGMYIVVAGMTRTKILK